MKNLIIFLLIILFSASMLYGQSDYKCNCKLVYGSKWGLNRITYFNDSLVTKEYASSALDSTGKLLYSNSNKFEDIYQKVNFRWLKLDTFFILNNIIGRRIGNYFYPHFPADSIKKGDKFVRYKKSFDKFESYSDRINAHVFYKMGDSVLNGEQISYFEKEDWTLINRSSIDEITKKNLNDFPFIKNDTANIYDSLDYFAYQETCSNPDPNNPNCYFCDFSIFKKGETPYKKEKGIELIYLEGDCEKFLKDKPTFVKGR